MNDNNSIDRQLQLQSSRLEALKEFVKVYREDKYLGDLSTLRAALRIGSFEPSESLRNQIAALKDNPDFGEIDFNLMPEGSLGREYGAFLEKNKLKPFRFSGRYLEIMKSHKLVVRYTCVHDLFHVLTGYDTSLAGEAGVWAFVAGQKFSPNAKTAARLTQILYPIVNPSALFKIRAAYREGLRNGAAAESLILVDFKLELQNPLVDVREKYKVVPTAL